ncbi:MAG: trypsin-like peptidase domain-containing protein, partial [Acutalibacteraceae bacterium]
MDDNNRFFNEPDNETSSVPEDTVETTASAQPEDSAQDNIPWYQQQSGNYSQSYQSQGGYSSDSEPSYSPYSSQSSQSGSYQSYQSPQDNKPDNNSGKKKGKKVLAVILAAVIVFCAGFGAYLIKGSKDEEKKEAGTSQGDTQLKIEDSAPNAESVASDGALSAKEIYDKVSPSCVGIILYSTGSSLFSSNSSSGSKSSIAGEGSGIIMGTNKAGNKTYVITCAHVISSANSSGYKVVVQDKDGEQYDATVVGYDSKTDLGVLAINKTGLP